MIPPALVFFHNVAEAIQDLLYFRMNFWNICTSSRKYATGILIGMVLNVLIALGSMDILMMLILPINEHGIYFHLFVSSLISFFHVV